MKVDIAYLACSILFDSETLDPGFCVNVWCLVRQLKPKSGRVVHFMAERCIHTQLDMVPFMRSV